jgi:DNA-directed RNA polymerase subunit beta
MAAKQIPTPHRPPNAFTVIDMNDPHPTVAPIYSKNSAVLSGLALKGAVKGIESIFPIQGSRYTMTVSNVAGDVRKVASSEEKDAIINSRSIDTPITGNVVITNNTTGDVVAREDRYPLAKSFLSTDKGTFLIQGNNYAVANQLVLRSGVYVREDNNGELEAHFNTASGMSFTLTMDPKTLLFYIQPRSSTSRQLLFPLLFALGATPDAQNALGNEIFHANVEASQGHEEKSLRFLFSNMAPKELQQKGMTLHDIKELLPAIMSNTKLDPEVTNMTLGHAHEHVSAKALVDAMRKIIKVYKGEEEQDNRDSLAFKKLRRINNHVEERFTKSDVSKKLKDKIKFRLDTEKEISVRRILPANFFTRVITDFFQSSSLASTPTETNPMDNFENMGKVTLLGEGGIQNEHAIPASARALDPSHFGVLDLVRTPESSHAGVDLRFSHGVHASTDGKIFTNLTLKDGRKASVSPRAIHDMTVGFPDDERNGKVLAVKQGKMVQVPKGKVDAWFGGPESFFTDLTHQIPFLNSDHPNRLVMAGKAIPQALSLKYREAPLVLTEGRTHRGAKVLFQDHVGQFSSIRATEDGVVTKVTPETIMTTSGVYEIPKNLPFNQKGFYNYEASVKEGDHFKKGDLLADSNYTKGGLLALGKNLNVAYMPFKGLNFEDGIVISKSAAESMTSQHMYVEKEALGRDVVTSLPQVRKFFPGKFTPQQLSNLDSRGFPVEGKVFHQGDPIYAFLQPRVPTAEDRMLGRLHKSLVKPYALVTQLWEHEDPGTVVEMGYHARNLRVAIRSDSALRVGDKLTGLHGNKGVVSKVVDDSEMPYDKNGTRMSLLLNPAGVTSRVNLGQVYEGLAGKIAKKMGRPYVVRNFSGGNNLDKLREDLKQHGLTDTEELTNPDTGKPYGSKIYTGTQYILKMNKTADSGASARGAGPSYDADMQPQKGGSDGAKKIGFMEWLGLLASDARHNLKEMGTVKSERSDYWHNFVEGMALPEPKTTFATQKFLHSLYGSGIYVKEGAKDWQATPMTDAHTLSLSKGELKNPGMIQAKNQEPEKGGLFDPMLTGGLRGERFTHYHLAEPILNPIMENSVRTLLGLSKVQLDKLISGEYYVKKSGAGYQIFDETGKPVKAVSPAEEEEIEDVLEKTSAAEQHYYGGEAFKKLLNFDVNKHKESVKQDYQDAHTKAAKEAALKKLKVLHGFANAGVNNPGRSLVINYVPVTPPRERPVLARSDGTLEYADINQLYKDSMLVNEGMKGLKEDLSPEFLTKERKDLHNSVKALQGHGEPINWASKSKGLKGFSEQIAGSSSPKGGYFQKKVLSKKQDFSGRLVLSENPELALDEAEIPEDVAWTMWKTHLLKNMIKKGYTYAEAEKAIITKTPAAKQALAEETKRVPLIINRNPTLLKSGLISVRAIPSHKRTLNINPLTFKGFNADIDGDQLNLYLPMSNKAVDEAWEKLSPKHNIMDFRSGAGGGVLSAPSHEAILGAHYLSTADENIPTRKFASREHVLAALKKGEITPDTPVEIG